MSRIRRESLDGGKSARMGSQHRRERSVAEMSGEREENLDFFSSDRRGGGLSVHNCDESQVMSLGKISIGSMKLPRSGMDDLLGSTDGGKHDYDWLLTPPGTPMFSSSDASELPSTALRNNSSVRSSVSTVKASRLSVSHSENSHTTRPTRSSSATRPSISSTHHSQSSNRISVLNTSSASVSSSRPSTPTSRSTIPSARLSPSTVRSMPVRPASPSKTRSSITSFSESKTKSSSNTRPSSNSRPSTPPARSHTAANLNSCNRSNSRPSTPIRRTQTPTLTSTARSSSVGRIRSNGRNSAPVSRASSPGAVARVSPQPIVLQDFPLDAPPNLRTTLPDRPVSAGRSRPGTAVSIRSNSGNCGPVNPPQRRSSSPVITRDRISDLSGSGRTRLQSNGHDVGLPDIRKPDATSRRNLKPATCTESTGFGRTISKKSLDMALRHMDIRHNVGNMKGPTGTLLFPHSVRPSASRCRPARVPDATPAVRSSSNDLLPNNGNGSNDAADGYVDYKASDDNKKNNNQLVAKAITELDPYESTRYDVILLKEDAKNMDWLHSADDKSDQSPVFDHRFEPLPEPFDLL